MKKVNYLTVLMSVQSNGVTLCVCYFCQITADVGQGIIKWNRVILFHYGSFRLTWSVLTKEHLPVLPDLLFIIGCLMFCIQLHFEN